MKLMASLMAVLLLSACAGEGDTMADDKQASAVQEANDVPSECVMKVESDDGMKFNINEMVIPLDCEQVQIVLHHTGALPKSAMGHNVVVAKKTDLFDILQDGFEAGADKDYLKPNDVRVVVATPMVGGGEETSVVFSPNKFNKNEDYEFFCSFPGHISTMRGEIKWQKAQP